MKQLFSLVFQLLSEAVQLPAGGIIDKSLVYVAIESLDQMLGWNFSHDDDSFAGNFGSRKVADSATSLADEEDPTALLSNSFPVSWRDVFANSQQLAALICKVQRLFIEKTNENTAIVHLSMQCLVHLAGLCGPVLSEGLSKTEQVVAINAYLSGYNTEFLQLLDEYVVSTFLTLTIDSTLQSRLAWKPETMIQSCLPFLKYSSAYFSIMPTISPLPMEPVPCISI